MCKFVFSVLSKTKSTGAMNIETDDKRYDQTVSESRVRNINGRAMLADSTVYDIPGTVNWKWLFEMHKFW